MWPCRAWDPQLQTSPAALIAWSVALQGSGAEDEDDDFGALAAFGCLRAISTVLESVSTLTHLFPQLEEILFPIMHKMCSQDGQDVFEEVLQIISYCTYFCEEVRPSFIIIAQASSGHVGCLTGRVPRAKLVIFGKLAGSLREGTKIASIRNDALCSCFKHRGCSRHKAIECSCPKSQQARTLCRFCVHLGGKRKASAGLFYLSMGQVSGCQTLNVS